MRLRFQRLHEAALLPTRANPTDAGLDLHSVEDVVVEAGSRVVIATGLALEIPESMAGLVIPRSGLALRHGISLVNAPGLIDPGYRGELKVLLFNSDRNDDFRVRVGDRIAQLLIVEHAALVPEWADQLGSSERGREGFGSSGLRPSGT